jgi:uncharacterized protein (AIM24 family)
MSIEATIESGFAHVTDGVWLMGSSQPVAYCGSMRDYRMRGWIVPDRRNLRNVELSGRAACSKAEFPFLCRIDCAEKLSVVSNRILVAPASSRTGSQLVRVVPMSFKYSLVTTQFKNPGWAITATKSRVNRFVLKDDEILSVRLESVVAWTTKSPTGHCPKLTMRDIMIPRRRAKSLWLNFYGPGVVWSEGVYGI